MRYIYEKGNETEPMHIQKMDNAARPKMEALCGKDRAFNATINHPYSLGKGVCEDCTSILDQE